MKTLTQHEKLLSKLSELYEVEQNNIGLIEPRAYDISAQFVTVPELQSMPDKTKVMLQGELSNFRVKSPGRFTFIYADFIDKSGIKQICQWVSSNKAAHSKMLNIHNDVKNKSVQIIASITSFMGNDGRIIFLSNPKYDEIIEQNSSGVIMPSPVYQLKGSTKAHEFKKGIQLTLKDAGANKYALPAEVEKKLSLPSLYESLQYIHGYRGVNADNIEQFLNKETVHHKRVRAEKIYRILKRLQSDKTAGKSKKFFYNKNELRELEDSLPFTLTNEQKKALGKMFGIIKNGTFKTMLLQGDVGSGKTAVSMFLSYTICRNNAQVAVLAPSAVLAKQLFDEYCNFLTPCGIEVVFLAGKTTKKQRDAIQKKVSKNNNIIVIGTTAVNNLEFNNLGLVIVDEEQKFGVDAKRALLKSTQDLPYLLYMSATPLPRSIQSSIYGNYEVIKIAAKPEGRSEVKSKIITKQSETEQLLNFIEEEGRKGRVSLIVAPSISSGELASIEKITSICEQRFPKDFFRVIHGQLKEKEIEKNIQDYRGGEFPLMIATSMVEAGFSHPELSCVVVTGPDRFGLSQLHQMRGRAGRRAGLKGYMGLWMLDYNYKPKVFERLSYFCKENDGFKLANQDLKNRGSGDLIGKAQSGGELNFVEYADEVEAILEVLDA